MNRAAKLTAQVRQRQLIEMFLIDDALIISEAEVTV